MDRRRSVPPPPPPSREEEDALNDEEQFHFQRVVGSFRGYERVACADGTALDVLEVQPQGKAAMSARAFCNGVQGVDVRWSDGRAGGE